MRRRLLTIAHSYVVTLNRRLAHELALAGNWDVTAVAPRRFHGDFGWHTLSVGADEACRVRGLDVHGSRSAHLMRYGGLAEILREPWDLVHCWEEPYVVAAWQVARGLPAAVPLVVATFQNIPKTYPPPFNWIERRVMRRATGIVAFGRTVHETLAARGHGHLPTRVIPPGVDAGLFRQDAERRRTTRNGLGWHDDVPVVGFLGRLIPQKGLSVFTAALDSVTAPWRALVVGAGPEEAAIRDWAARYPGRVAIVTDAGHADVPPLLDAMDLLCAPSLTTAAWREQFGRMLIEAFASGVPVVASDSGEIPFVVGDAGVVVPEGDVAAWGTAIGGLLADAPRRAALAARGRARVDETFAWPVVARRHLDFFDELVGADR